MKINASQSKLGRKTLHNQTREVVNNVHAFLKSEAASGYFVIQLNLVIPDPIKPDFA